MTDAMKPIVQARRCAAESPDERVREVVAEMLDGLGNAADSLSSMRLIAVKANLAIKDVRWHQGRQISLSDASVIEAAVAWLRAHTDAEIVVGDGSVGDRCEDIAEAIGLTRRLAPLRARVVDFNDEPHATFEPPNGGLMFRRYRLSETVARADMVVSVAKMKSHLATGASLSLKNLFGFPPTGVYGNPRRYLHAAVRLPRVIADMGCIVNPALCIVDAMVGQTREEWHSDPVTSNWLLAGNNTVATDAVGMTLMGIDPAGEYPDPPFNFDLNPVKLAAGAGLGPLGLEEIDIRGDSLELADGYYSDRHWDVQTLDEIRHSTAEQAVLFDENRDVYLKEFAGQFIGLYDGKVIYAGETLNHLKSRGKIAKEYGKTNKGLYIKRVVPLEDEDELLAPYRNLLNGSRL